MDKEEVNGCDYFNPNTNNTNARALFENTDNEWIFKPLTDEKKQEINRFNRFMVNLEKRLLKAVKKNIISKEEAYKAVEMVHFTHTSPFILWDVEKTPNKSCIISKTAFMFFNKYELIDFDSFMSAMHDIGAKWKYDFKNKIK